MAKCNSPNIYPNLNDQQQFRFDTINEVRDYFIGEIRERELMSKRLSKYIAFFYYFDRFLIVLSVTRSSISIASTATVIGAPVGIANTTFSLTFLMSTGVVEKLLKTTRNRKKNHDKIVMLARSKLNSIESKTSEALIKMKSVMRSLQQLLVKKKTTVDLKKTLQ